jgi:hypothetical protein
VKQETKRSRQQPKKIRIFTHYKRALSILQEQKRWKSSLVIEILEAISSLTTPIIFSWAPAQEGVEGSSLADQVAKAALGKPGSKDNSVSILYI